MTIDEFLEHLHIYFQKLANVEVRFTRLGLGKNDYGHYISDLIPQDKIESVQKTIIDLINIFKIDTGNIAIRNLNEHPTILIQHLPQLLFHPGILYTLEPKNNMRPKLFNKNDIKEWDYDKAKRALMVRETNGYCLIRQQDGFLYFIIIVENKIYQRPLGYATNTREILDNLNLERGCFLHPELENFHQLINNLTIR